MTYSFDASFSPDEPSQDKRPADYQCPLVDTMPAHYAWLSLNPGTAKLSRKRPEAQWLIQRQQQRLIDTHGLDAQELGMMLSLKKVLQAETQHLVQRVGHWLQQFDPSLNLEDENV